MLRKGAEFSLATRPHEAVLCCTRSGKLDRGQVASSLLALLIWNNIWWFSSRLAISYSVYLSRLVSIRPTAGHTANVL